MTKTVKQKLLYGLAIGCVTIALGGIALAHEDPMPPKEDSGRCMQGMHQPPGFHDPAQFMSDKLKALVENNTINQTQADQIAAFFQTKHEERKAEFEKMKGMTPEERKAYREEHKAQKPDMIANLKASANLTEEQAKAVDEAVRPPHGPKHPDFARHINHKLNVLVEQNTINQAQADRIQAFLKQKGEEFKAEFEKMKGMAPEERKAYMEELRAQRPDIIADLKANTGLTEEQAKAVAEAIRPPHAPHGPHGMPDCDENMPPR